LSGGANLGATLHRLGNEGPHINNWGYNNTCYNSASASEAFCVELGEDLSQSVAANNLLIAPQVNNKEAALDQTGANTLENNHSIDDPAFATSPPTSPRHFALTAASSAIDQGSTRGQANGDYLMNPRCSNGDGQNGTECDVGAFEYQE
jgi:hypothetical protein